MEDQMKTIRQRIKEVQDPQKSYADANRVDSIYEVGNRVLLRVKPHKSSIKFGKGDKISPRFMGPFEIMERKGPVAYQPALPDSLRHMHDFLHISVLRHYISDPTHVIDMSSLQVFDEGLLTVEPIRILDHRIRQLWCRIVDQVKVQWNNYCPHSMIWEDAYDMRQQFSFLFD
jgi:hypothetical protein